MAFAADMLVEVCRDDGCFRGVWYVACILRVDELRALLEYKDLVRENGQALTEEVSWECVRPIPSASGVKHWMKGDDVEAFHKDGWWRGVVSEVLPRKRFLVYFKHSDEESAFPAFKIRCRQDWCDGKWNFPTLRDELNLDVSGSPQASWRGSFTVMKCDLQEKEQEEEKRKTASHDQNVVLTEISVEKSDMSDPQNEDGNVAGKFLSLQCDKTSSTNHTEASTELKLITAGHHSVSATRALVLQESCHKDSSHVMQPQDIKTLSKNVNKRRVLRLRIQNHKRASRNACTNAVPKKEAKAGHPKLSHNVKRGLAQKPSQTAKMTSKGKRKVELTAYFWLLKAVHCRGFVGWKEEVMLTDVRCLLRISNEEHASQLTRVISSCLYE